VVTLKAQNFKRCTPPGTSNETEMYYLEERQTLPTLRIKIGNMQVTNERADLPRFIFKCFEQKIRWADKHSWNKPLSNDLGRGILMGDMNIRP
jgi:hypothetical protein